MDSNISTMQTNTVLLTNFISFENNIEEIIFNLIESKLKLNFYSFSKIKTLRRFIVVFYNTTDAKVCLSFFNNMEIGGSLIKCYYGQHFNFETLHENKLSVPASSKNFLLSPPGDPPVGWIQTSEDRPHVMNLKLALEGIGEDGFSLDGPSENVEFDDLELSSKSNSHFEEKNFIFGCGLPKIQVEDFTDHNDFNTKNNLFDLNKRSVTPLPRTSMPPMVSR